MGTDAVQSWTCLAEGREIKTETQTLDASNSFQSEKERQEAELPDSGPMKRQGCASFGLPDVA